ncbi:MAG TPA: type II toxin-antitoxin system HicB family antitoxin [Longimicrobium sp.]|nr:type II toxin-antitoxin system HicB family antitoxin [Longimicrobium sp.]
MKYKGYSGSVEPPPASPAGMPSRYDPDDRLFCGRVEGITDIVSFEGTTVEELEADFRAGVDDYLSFCEERGVEPQRPCSGKFVLRISPELHREALMAARTQRESLNTWITRAIEARVGAKERPADKPRPRTKRAA